MSVSVLFVCLGNICRSPRAEVALRRVAERLGLQVEVDSAGTGDWHIGRPPDPRAIAVAARNGIDISRLQARQVAADDFRRFDHIVALDTKNMAALRRMQPMDGKAKLSLLLDHVEGQEGESVPDPYHDHSDPFDFTWAVVTAGAAGLARKLASGR